MNFKEEFMRAVINDPVAQSHPIEIYLAGRVGKRWHTEHQCDYGREFDDQARFRYLPQDIRLSELGDRLVCPQCFHLPETTLNSALTSVVEAELIQKALFENEARSYQQVDWWQVSLEYLLDDIEHTLEASENAPLAPRMEALLSESEALGARLTQLYKSPSVEETLKAWVLNLTHNLKNDTELRLIGFSKLGLPPQKWEAGIFQAFVIDSDARRVILHAPKYIEDAIKEIWETHLRDEDYKLSSTLAPEDLQLRETAAKLWDPLGEGPLATMEGALKTAEAL